MAVKGPTRTEALSTQEAIRCAPTIQGDAAQKPSADVLPNDAKRRHLAERFGAAIGCKASELAMTILGQVISLESPNAGKNSEQQTTELLNAIAILIEMKPTTATEAMLAAQTIGSHKLAMEFLRRAMLEGQTSEGIDANLLRAIRLMRLFTEQTAAMNKLKGKGGQQRVVVEHVNVAAGGQAIVGNLATQGRGTDDDT
jgi:hypothetical protein